MDILEIIKINRVARAFFTANTTPKERELVKFFDDYTLHSGDDKNQNQALDDVFEDEDLVEADQDDSILKGGTDTSLKIGDQKKLDQINLYQDMLKTATAEDLFGDLDFNKPVDNCIAKAILAP